VISFCPSKLLGHELGNFRLCGSRQPSLRLGWIVAYCPLYCLRKMVMDPVLYVPPTMLMCCLRYGTENPLLYAVFFVVWDMEQKILCCMHFSLMCYVAYTTGSKQSIDDKKWLGRSQHLFRGTLHNMIIWVFLVSPKALVLLWCINAFFLFTGPSHASMNIHRMNFEHPPKVCKKWICSG